MTGPKSITIRVLLCAALTVAAHGMALGPWGYAACVTACEAGCVGSCVVAGPVCTLCFDKCFAVCTPACYSADSLVLMRVDGGRNETVPVPAVRPGDVVLTLTAGQHSAASTDVEYMWTTVTSNDAYSSPLGFDYIDALTAKGQRLTVTVDHVVATLSAPSLATTKRAMHLRVDDVLLTTQGADTVAALTRTTLKDKYNLVTSAGTVLTFTSAGGVGVFTPTLCNAAADAKVGGSSGEDEVLTLSAQLQHWRQHHGTQPNA